MACIYVIRVHQTDGEFGQGGQKSKDTALIHISAKVDMPCFI